jgi:hypothetical protein
VIVLLPCRVRFVVALWLLVCPERSPWDPGSLRKPTDQSAGQARTGTGAVRSRDCLEAQVTAPLGRAPEPRDGMVRRGRRGAAGASLVP